jgi:hypothetical protein
MVGPYLVQDATLQTPRNAIAIAQQSKLIRAPYLAAGSCFLLVGLCVFICYLVHVSQRSPSSDPNSSLVTSSHSVHLSTLDRTQPYQPPNRKVFGPKRSRQHSTAIDSQSDQLSTQSSVVRPAQPLWFRALFVTLILTLFSVEVSCEYNLLMYLAPYLSRGRLHISRQTAANLSATFGMAYTAGRGTSMMLALCRQVSVAFVFYTQMITALVACALLGVRNGPDAIWTVQCAVWLLGLGFSSAFPNMMVFIEQRVNITDRLNCAMLALSTLLFSACSPVIGHLLQTKPNAFELIMIAAVLLLLTLFALLHSTDRLRLRLHKQFVLRTSINRS